MQGIKAAIAASCSLGQGGNNLKKNIIFLFLAAVPGIHLIPLKKWISGKIRFGFVLLKKPLRWL